jgi:hypothetical protein
VISITQYEGLLKTLFSLLPCEEHIAVTYLFPAIKCPSTWQTVAICLLLPLCLLPLVLGGWLLWSRKQPASGHRVVRPVPSASVHSLSRAPNLRRRTASVRGSVSEVHSRSHRAGSTSSGVSEHGCVHAGSSCCIGITSLTLNLRNFILQHQNRTCSGAGPTRRRRHASTLWCAVS